jgi:hypothetical protein
MSPSHTIPMDVEHVRRSLGTDDKLRLAGVYRTKDSCGSMQSD